MTELNTVREAVKRVYASYVKAKPYFAGQYDREIRHPEWTRRLLDTLDRPDAASYNVAVTGSKGKGSHSIFMACMLESIGYRVGLFTSPHLVDFMERFRVQGTIMPEPVFLALAAQVLDIVDTFDMPQDQYCGPVGILAALSCLWFREQRTDVNVIECGRGALHDDVNQVIHQGALLTPVFMEHALQLGPTLHDIGVEKAGVITPTTRWLTTHMQELVVQAALTSQIHSTRLPHQTDFDLAMLDDSFRMEVTLRGPETDVTIHANGRPVATAILDAAYRPFAVNAAVALHGALQVVNALGLPNVSKRQSMTHPSGLVFDLRRVQLPGRLHVVQTKPLTVIDGCIHASSAELVRQWLSVQLDSTAVERRVGAIFGLPADKDGMGVLETLGPLLDWCVFSKAHNPHLKFSDTWFEAAKQRGMTVSLVESIEEASVIAQERLNDKDILLVLGTQSFVGDSLVHFGANSSAIWKEPMR